MSTPATSRRSFFQTITFGADAADAEKLWRNETATFAKVMLPGAGRREAGATGQRAGGAREISTLCGYPSPAHFQTQFRRFEGRSPLEYRTAVRGIVEIGKIARLHPPGFALPSPQASAAADPLQCPYCGAAGSKRGKRGKHGRKFRNASALRQHWKWCAHRPPDAGTGAEARPPSATAPASAPAAEHKNDAATRRAALQVVRFCGGCGLNLEAVKALGARFCPACGVNLDAIAAALNPTRNA